jgi:hypothetical protein
MLLLYLLPHASSLYFTIGLIYSLCCNFKYIILDIILLSCAIFTCSIVLIFTRYFFENIHCLWAFSVRNFIGICGPVLYSLTFYVKNMSEIRLRYIKLKVL